MSDSSHASWGNVHARSTSSDSSTLLQALSLSSARVLVLALHIIIVVIAASGADEEGSREKRRRAGTDLLDGGDVVGQRSGVEKHRLVEPNGSIN